MSKRGVQDGVANDSQTITQARARLEPRETATTRDAQDVVEIFKHRCNSSMYIAVLLLYVVCV